MKPFEELSRLGRIRRMRQLAKMALPAYGLSDPCLTFLKQAGNTLFRVNEAIPSHTARADLYLPGQYLLRIHQPGYQSTEAIDLELAWLAAMCRDAGLPVPEPVATSDGALLTQASISGIPVERACSLLCWVRGRAVGEEQVRPHHYRAQGRLMARLHQHAEHWQAPSGLAKRKYDWDGLFREDGGAGIPASEAWPLLPPNYVAPFEAVASRVKRVMNAWGKGPEVFGLIHADLGLDANVLFWRGEARAIDFDDSGFGYYAYDLAVGLENCQEDEALPRYREALLEGYTQIRPLPRDQIDHLDLMLAGFWVYWSLWAAVVMMRFPRYREELLERMTRYFEHVERYLAKS
jgi:Ser/Thr protein kinase RdoA (MazF antagonist)